MNSFYLVLTEDFLIILRSRFLCDGLYVMLKIRFLAIFVTSTFKQIRFWIIQWSQKKIQFARKLTERKTIDKNSPSFREPITFGKKTCSNLSLLYEDSCPIRNFKVKQFCFGLKNMLLIMERDTLALSALLQRNSPAHVLVKLPPFASSYQELSEKKTSDPTE